MKQKKILPWTSHLWERWSRSAFQILKVAVDRKHKHNGEGDRWSLSEKQEGKIKGKMILMWLYESSNASVDINQWLLVVQHCEKHITKEVDWRNEKKNAGNILKNPQNKQEIGSTIVGCKPD